MNDRPNLRDRARGNPAAGRGGTDLVLKERRAEFTNGLALMEAQFQAAMPSGIEAKQLARDALTLVQNNPKLLQLKDQRSLYGALMTCAQVGLRPIPQLGLAYVVPFKGRAQFIAGYKGLAQLAHRSGQIRGITNRVVRRGDYYLTGGGDSDSIVHTPKAWPDRPTQEELAELDPVAYYAIVRDLNGGRYSDAMWRWQMIDHAEKHALQREWNPATQKNDGPIKGPWRTDFDAMALKTTIRFALRVAPQSVELQRALAADESIRVDTDPVADIESTLIDPATIADAEDVTDAELVDDVDPTERPGFGTEGFRG